MAGQTEISRPALHHGGDLCSKGSRVGAGQGQQGHGELLDAVTLPGEVSEIGPERSAHAG